MYETKSRILSLFAKLFPCNWGKDYPQTWYLVVKLPRQLQVIVQFMCGLTGHELSRTEWGYCGGQYADRWCRWCNKMIKVPKESVYFNFEKSKKLMKQISNTEGLH